MRRTAAVAAALLGAAAFVLPPAHADDLPGPRLTALPFFTSSDRTDHVTGGDGSAILNDAVSRTCHAGQPIARQQWYVLPAGDLGTLDVRAVARYWLGGSRTAEALPTGVAVVDYTTGAVISCGGPVRVASGGVMAVVAYVDAGA